MSHLRSQNHHLQAHPLCRMRTIQFTAVSCLRDLLVSNRSAHEILLHLMRAMVRRSLMSLVLMRRVCPLHLQQERNQVAANLHRTHSFAVVPKQSKRLYFPIALGPTHHPDKSQLMYSPLPLRQRRQ